MTEIDGKKYYTFDEIRAMPLGTKVKLSYWSENSFIFFRRQEYGAIVIADEDQEIMNISDFDEDLLYQDRFEIYEEKREYVTGCQALEKLINGEWEKIACDHEDWPIQPCIDEEYIKAIGCSCSTDCIRVSFLRLKKWYEYKEQQ